MKALEACEIASGTNGAAWTTSFVVIFAVFVFVDILFSGWTIAKIVRNSEIKKL